MVDLSVQGTQASLAKLVGVTQQAVSAMNLPGGALGDMLLAYCDRLREVAAGRGSYEDGGLDLVQERAALAREQRLGIEIKNATLRGEYAPISLLSETLASASQSVVERFEQLPGTLKRACPDLTDAQRDRVMNVIAQARNEWARGTERLTRGKLSEFSEDDIILTDEAAA